VNQGFEVSWNQSFRIKEVSRFHGINYLRFQVFQVYGINVSGLKSFIVPGIKFLKLRGSRVSKFMGSGYEVSRIHYF
jgi:hypothetical protein